MNQGDNINSPEDLVKIIDEQGLELATLRFEAVYATFAIALPVAFLMRFAPPWLKIGMLALTFSPVVLWGIAVQRYSSVRLARTGVHIETDFVAWKDVARTGVHIETDFVAWKDVALLGGGRPLQRPSQRSLFARRELHLVVAGRPVICLATALALPRKIRDPLGFVPFLHDAVAAKIAEAAGSQPEIVSPQH